MGVDKPSAPDVDYGGMWKNYLTWTSEQTSRFNRERGHSEATMARQGLKRGSQAWELNLSNMRKQQDKDRARLGQGVTASQLKEQIRREMRMYGAQNTHKAPDYKAIARQEFESEMQTAYADWQRSWRQDRDPMKLGAGAMSRYAGGHDKMPTWAEGIVSVDERVKEMESKNTTQYEKGKWFETIKTSTYVGGDADRWLYGKRFQMTDAGKKKMQELMTGSDNVLGRQMEEWEAYATLRYGSDFSESGGPSEAELSAGRASAAASGARASAAEMLAEQAATASPWVKKQTSSFF